MTHNYFAGRNLTFDWVSSHLRVWERILEDKKSESARILEIGSFEGRSALFFLQFLAESQVICVDTFEGSVEHLQEGSRFESDMEAVERRFDENMAPFGSRVEKRKGPSQRVLPDLISEERAFDVVYVDGDHRPLATFYDASLAWKMLRPGGIMILDDYEWTPDAPDQDEPPTAGIDAFLLTIADQHDELHRGYQIILSKKVPAATGLRFRERSVGQRTVGAVSPPLVSFVVINWNYGRFVGQTIDSIRNQDYSNFECLVIDNGSDDDSVAVIARHIKGDRRFRCFELPENIGQLGAAAWAMDRINGAFVSFVDADDVLFDSYASTHVQVHLALPKPVGFTSGTVAEMDQAGNILTSRHAQLKTKHQGARSDLLPASRILRLDTVSDADFEALAEATAIYAPAERGWIWAPGTANMYRRSILRLVESEIALEKGMQTADGYFNRLCHALAGSAGIDVPVSAYRIHGKNNFVAAESIPGFRNGTRETMQLAKDSHPDRVEVFLRNSGDLAWPLGSGYWMALDNVARVWHGTARKFYKLPETKALFVAYASELRKVFGKEAFIFNISGRFDLRSAASIVRAGVSGKLSLRDFVKLYFYGIAYRIVDFVKRWKKSY